MPALSSNFDQYWQTADTGKKLVPLKQKRKKVVLNFANNNIQQVSFELPELEEVIEERACILASDIELPFDWAYAVVKLRNVNRPKNIPIASWLEIEKACATLYNNNFELLKKIIAYDWSLPDIYGCKPNNPCNIFNSMGLLLLLKPTDSIVEVRKDSIKIRTKSGNISSFYPRLDQNVNVSLLCDLP